MFLALVDCRLKHLALGREPEAVVDEARVFRHQFVLEVHRAAVERDALDAAVRGEQDGPAGRLVNAARLHSDEAVFDQVQAADAIVVAELIELRQQRRRRQRLAIDRDRIALLEVDSDRRRLIGRVLGRNGGFQPLAGVSPDVSTDHGTITVNNCAWPGVTDISGQCTVTVNSDTVGVATITASFTGTAPGTGQVPQTKTVTAQATKTWIAYQLVLTPGQAINQFPIPEQRTHDITATLTGLPDNTAAPVAGQTLTLTLTSNASTITAVSPSGTIAGDGKSTTCVTDTNGQCVITLMHNRSGIALVQGSYLASVGGGSQTFTSNTARKAWVKSTTVSVSAPRSQHRREQPHRDGAHAAVRRPRSCPWSARSPWSRSPARGDHADPDGCRAPAPTRMASAPSRS